MTMNEQTNETTSPSEKLNELEKKLELGLEKVKAAVLYGGASNLEICYQAYLRASDNFYQALSEFKITSSHH